MRPEMVAFWANNGGSARQPEVLVVGVDAVVDAGDVVEKVVVDDCAVRMTDDAAMTNGLGSMRTGWRYHFCRDCCYHH